MRHRIATVLCALAIVIGEICCSIYYGRSTSPPPVRGTVIESVPLDASLGQYQLRIRPDRGGPERIVIADESVAHADRVLVITTDERTLVRKE